MGAPTLERKKRMVYMAKDYGSIIGMDIFKHEFIIVYGLNPVDYAAAFSKT